jgi:hypothetical protein
VVVCRLVDARGLATSSDGRVTKSTLRWRPASRSALPRGSRAAPDRRRKAGLEDPEAAVFAAAVGGVLAGGAGGPPEVALGREVAAGTVAVAVVAGAVRPGGGARCDLVGVAPPRCPRGRRPVEQGARGHREHAQDLRARRSGKARGGRPHRSRGGGDPARPRASGSDRLSVPTACRGRELRWLLRQRADRRCCAANVTTVKWAAGRNTRPGGTCRCPPGRTPLPRHTPGRRR